jgi:tetratricopeptide (TPR) repeat protein
VARQVEAALAEADKERQAGRWPAVRAALERARRHFGGGGPAGLRDRVEQAVRDADVVAALEQVRLRQADVKDGQFDILSADAGHADAFRGYGMELDGSDPEDAAVQVRQSAIRDHLLVALDHWWVLRRRKGDRAGADWLRAVADRADEDRWRAGLRAAVAAGEVDRLKGLADQAAGQPPAVQVVLARALRNRRAEAEAEAVPRRGVAGQPADFWLAHELGYLLADEKRWGEAEGFYRVALGLRPESPGAWLNLGLALSGQGKLDEAVVCYRRALKLDPNYVNAHNNLAVALKQQGKVDEAIACYRRATELDPKDPQSHYNLGNALQKLRKSDEAVACFRLAVQLNPKYALAHYNLGLALGQQGPSALDEAADCFRRAIEVDPKFALAHTNLGTALYQQGKVDEAAGCFRRAIEVDPKLALAHFNLGNAVLMQGKVEEAAACYRRAIELDPRNAQAHTNLGNVLLRQGKLDEAVACYRRALELDPNHTKAHYSLGNALKQQGNVDEAVACYRRAIQLNPKYPEAHCNLGHALRDLGRFREALAALETGHQLGSRSAGWRYPSADWVRDCRRLAELDDRLPAVLSGADHPAEAERLDFIRVCGLTQRFAAAAGLYAKAFAAQPRLAEDLRAQHRYAGACYAAQAGSGQGTDAPRLTPAGRLRWRRQALTWLRDDLAAWASQLSADPSAGPLVAQQLRHLQANPDLAGLRDPALLARLSSEERTACDRLWADVAALLRRAEPRN